jgi:hypothetical protein
MKPVIVNKKSKFVVITYWWGRGNINGNTGRPCKSDDYQDVDNSKSVPSVTYDAMIKNWEKSCSKQKCNYMAVEYPEFAKKGMYQNAINHKPTFIKDALKACYPLAVVYIDGDMIINRYPRIFDLPNIDYMARHWQVDARQHEWKKKKQCYDPYVFETSGGTMYFNNTPKAHALLDMWSEKSKLHVGKADDRIVSLYFNTKKMLLSMAVLFLPNEYLWLNLDFDKKFDKATWKRSHVYISHPECLTGEDTAADQGADTNRYPKNYQRFVEDYQICGREYQKLYEFIYFPNKQYRTTMKYYMEWLSMEKYVNVIPYASKYGQYNSNADKNTTLMKSVKLPKYKNPKNVFITHNDLGHTHQFIVKSKTLVIPTILKHLTKGHNVIYVPQGTSSSSLNAIIKRANNKTIEFAARNMNEDDYFYKKEFMMEIDAEYPMFFSSENETLYHMLMMCRRLTTIDTVFNSSIDFLSRIRCEWV